MWARGAHSAGQEQTCRCDASPANYTKISWAVIKIEFFFPPFIEIAASLRECQQWETCPGSAPLVSCHYVPPPVSRIRLVFCPFNPDNWQPVAVGWWGGGAWYQILLVHFPESSPSWRDGVVPLWPKLFYMQQLSHWLLLPDGHWWWWLQGKGRGGGPLSSLF